MPFGRKDNASQEPSAGLFKATREIEDYFKNIKNWKCKTQRTENTSSVEIDFNGDNVIVKVRFISVDDDNDVLVRAYEVVTQIPEGKRPAILEVVNSLNDKYRYAKFVLYDRSVDVEYDFPIGITEVGKVAAEIVSQFVKIIDEAYHELMKALWG